jgi:poly-gamma-glutamate capsule biosynthesis protein CapA/YwtB (metallophosphatase superfamily)
VRLANNHVLDYGFAGLEETLRTLEAAAIQTVGAGIKLDQARRPAIVNLPGDCGVTVFSFGTETSGIPRSHRSLSIHRWNWIRMVDWNFASHSVNRRLGAG